MPHSKQAQYSAAHRANTVGEVLTGSALQSLLVAGNPTIECLLASAERIKTDKVREVLVATLPNDEKLLCKVHKEIGVIARLRCWLLASKAERGHIKNKQLTQLGFNGPVSTGYILRNRYGRDCDSIHFTQFFDDAETVEAILRENSINNDELLSQLAGLLSALHGKGYVHGDAKLSNFLVVNNTLTVIDLDGFSAFSRKWTPARDIARVLTGLSEESVSKATMAEFLQRYCDSAGLSLPTLKKELQPLIEKFQSKHQQKYGIAPVDIV